MMADVTEIARRGIVFIAWSDNDGEESFYFGYWDGAAFDTGLPDGGFLEQMPETPSIDVALDCARARSDRIKIRPSWDPAHSYSAGPVPTGEPLPELPDQRPE